MVILQVTHLNNFHVAKYQSDLSFLYYNIQHKKSQKKVMTSSTKQTIIQKLTPIFLNKQNQGIVLWAHLDKVTWVIIFPTGKKRGNLKQND